MEVSSGYLQLETVRKPYSSTYGKTSPFETEDVKHSVNTVPVVYQEVGVGRVTTLYLDKLRRRSLYTR